MAPRKQTRASNTEEAVAQAVATVAKQRGFHTGMKTSHSTTPDIGSSVNLQQTTLDRIYSMRTENAGLINQIRSRVYQLTVRLNGVTAKAEDGGEDDVGFISNGRLNDLLDDLGADNRQLSEILADLDHLDRLL